MNLINVYKCVNFSWQIDLIKKLENDMFDWVFFFKKVFKFIFLYFILNVFFLFYRYCVSDDWEGFV